MNGHRCLLLLSFLTLTFQAQAAAELLTRTFKIPPDFLIQRSEAHGGAAPAAPADPFAAGGDVAPVTTEPLLQRTTAQQILAAQGITFPEGATATFNPATGLLTVTNTQPNLDLAEAFVEVIQQESPRTVAYTLTVIEGPGELIRQANAAASRSTDAAPELALLLGYAKNAGSNVRVVGDAFLEAKSGVRAITEAVREHIYASDLEMDAKSRATVIQEMRPLGLRLEIEPVVGADRHTIDSTFSLELHPAPPQERQVSITEPITGSAAAFPTTDFHGAKLTTSITSSSGSTKLIGLTKPVGTSQENEDILWAAFLTGSVRRLEAPARPQPTATPAGLVSATFAAPAGLFEAWMDPPHQKLHDWLKAQGIQHGPGAIWEQRDGILHVTNTPAMIEAIGAMVEYALSNAARTVAFTLHTVQAPAAFLRDLTRQNAASGDQTAMWATVAAAAERGEATFINSLFCETKSGMRGTHEAVRELVYLSEFGTTANGLPHLAFEMRQVGSILEVEHTVGADGSTVEVTLSYELHPAPPTLRRDHFRDPASKQDFDMPVVDFHSIKTVTDLVMTKGGTKLLSLNKPTGRDDHGMLWATFLKCDLVPQLRKVQPVVEIEVKPEPPADPKAWSTHSYRAPPDFLQNGSPGKNKPITAKMALESIGIPFPEGATASFNPALSRMFVKNTNENLDLVAAFFESMLWDPPSNTTFTTHVLQGPGPLLRRLTAQAASKCDHRAELDELLAAVKTGTVQHLNTARIETKSGTRATTEQGQEHSAISEVSVNDKGAPSFEQETRLVGLRVELEPTVGADGVTVELSIAPEFHPAPPFEHREHIIDTQGRRLEFPLTDYHQAKVTTGITLPDDTARLLSLYKPTGKPEFEKEDILQVIFITCDVLRVGK